MAFPTMQYQQELATQRFANALYDTQAGSVTLNNVLGDMNALGGAAAAFNAYYNFSFGNMSTAQVAVIMADNLGIVVGENGIDEVARDIALTVVEEELNAVPAAERGATVSALLEGWGTLYLADETFGAAAAAFNAEVDTAMEYTGAADVTVGTDTEVTDFYLTSGQDILTGTASDDNFNAPLAQNPWAGGMSNTLASADVLDGGAGYDVLNANLVPEFFGVTGLNQLDIQPRIKNIETIELQVQDFVPMLTNSATFDAKNVTDVQKIGSYYSDGNLVIENLTTLTSNGPARNTDAITITMDHTDNFNSDGDASDLTVYFDEDYLLSGRTASSFVEYFLLDQDADMRSTDVDGDGQVDLLANINANGIRFNVDGGPEVVLTFDSALLGTNALLSHSDFVAALQQPLQDLIAAGQVPADTTLTLDTTRFRTTFLDNGSVSSQIPAILIQTETSAVFNAVGFAWVEDLVGDYNVYGRMNDDATTSNAPVAVNVELHKVGRAGEGGDLFIGGKSVGKSGYSDHVSDGIPNIYIDVLGDASKPSDLGSINTNTNMLENVYISTKALLGAPSFASLTVRDGFDDQTSVNLVDASNFLGDLTLGTNRGFTGGTAVQNLSTLVATGGGDVVFVGDIDFRGNYNYTTGAGEDIINIDLDTFAISTIGTSLTINTNGGNDNVYLDGSGVASQRTMAALDNVHINTGAGDDDVLIYDEVRANIHAGSGSDFVEFAGGDSGAWLFGQATGPQNFGERVLYQAQLTVTFAGFESRVAINTDANGNFVADQLTINAAIADAIAKSPELSRLLEITEGTGYQQIRVSSLVGGENDLRVNISQPELVAGAPTAGQVQIPSANFSQLVQGIINTTALDSDDLTTAAAVQTALAGGNNFGGANFNGNINANAVVGADYHGYTNGGSTDGGVANYSVINMGSGSNDLLVLDSNDNSANVIVVDQVFGKVSVVNFHDDSPNNVTNVSQVGNHALDFSSFLDNKIDPSATVNQQSAVLIQSTLNTNAQLAGSPASTGVALANSVNMLNFDATVANSIKFGDLTAANLVAALNGTAGTTVVGGLVDGTLDAANNTVNLIGSVQKHVVMVENNANRGEYKVFSLTSTVDAATNTTNGDFDAGSAQLLGTLDFGKSINFNLVGNDAWDARLDALLTAADLGVDPVDPGPVDPGPVDPDPVDVTVVDLITYDASDGDYNFILDFSTAGAKFANINGFGEGDTVTLTNAPVGASMVFDSSSVDSIDFGYGDLDTFSNAWIVQMGALEESLVDDVVAAADLAAQQAVLDTAWGDWIVA